MKPLGAVRLHVEPITVQRANEYVEIVHRHHGASPTGFAMFSIAAVDDLSVIRGVATAAIPNAANRLTDGFRTMEVVRVATDGTPNACSVLYAACARAAKALGFSKIISYILETETGTSLKAAGWVEEQGEFGNLSWANRPGRTGNNFGPKGRWMLDIAGTQRPVATFPSEVEEARVNSRSQMSLLDLLAPEDLSASHLTSSEEVQVRSLTGALVA